MLYYLHHLEHFFGPLRLFRYITFRGNMALVTALLWGIWMGPKIFAAPCQGVRILKCIRFRHKPSFASTFPNRQRVLFGGILAFILLKFDCRQGDASKLPKFPPPFNAKNSSDVPLQVKE